MENVHSSYQRACVVISGDVLEDWKYIFRELKTRVRVSFQFQLEISSKSEMHYVMSTRKMLKIDNENLLVTNQLNPISLDIKYTLIQQNVNFVYFIHIVIDLFSLLPQLYIRNEVSHGN